VQFHVLRDANAVAEKASEINTAEAHSAVSARGQFTFAVSGGQTPWRMLRTLSAKELPWAHVFVFQVDERVAPDGDSKRNLTHLREKSVAWCRHASRANLCHASGPARPGSGGWALRFHS
jgi:6-phosphogluconolactonase/glucosamine-6-phosphate isomerase/deaminase